MAKTYNELVLILMIPYGEPNFLLPIGLTRRQTNEPLDSILNINRLWFVHCDIIINLGFNTRI